MTDEHKRLLDKAERLLDEALSGTSPKSKTTLIKEALRAIRQIKS